MITWGEHPISREILDGAKEYTLAAPDKCDNVFISWMQLMVAAAAVAQLDAVSEREDFFRGAKMAWELMSGAGAKMRKSAQ